MKVKALQNGNTEIVSFAELVENEFMRLYKELDVANASAKEKPNIIDSFWNDIYKAVFKPSEDETIYNNCKSRLTPYKVDDVEEVVNMFIKLNQRYGGVIKYNTFCEMVGYHTYTLNIWNKANNTNGYVFSLSDIDMQTEFSNIYIIRYTDNDIKYNGNNRYNTDNNDKLSRLRFDIKKKLHEIIYNSNTNGLSLDTTGHIVRANQDEEVGKMYEPRRMAQQEQAKLITRTPEQIAQSYGKLIENDTQLELPEVPE